MKRPLKISYTKFPIQVVYCYNLKRKINLRFYIMMLGDFQVMSLQQFITNKIIVG